MSAPRILLTGKNGQVGFELQRALAPIGEITALGSDECDLSDAERIRALINELKPDLIVNPAAYTAVDKAETEHQKARSVNTDAPGIIGQEAEKIGATVVHFSTDYVFDGTKQDPYFETDKTNPRSVYGKSKLDGELALIKATQRHLIIRTSWVAGAHGNNFSKTMLRIASERVEMNVVSDQFGAPTSAALVADITAHIVRQLFLSNRVDFPYGLYHLTASGQATWHAYAKFVIEEAIKMGYSLKVRPENILPVATSAYPTAAARPKNSRLDTNKLTETFGLTIPHWQVGIKHVLQQILDR